MFSSQFSQCILLSETPWHLASLASPWRKYICILLTSFFCQHWKLHPVEPHLFVRPATINRNSSKITFSELMRDLSLRKVPVELDGLVAQLGGCPNRVAARRTSGAVARAACFPAGDTETGAGARSNSDPWLFRFLLVSNLDACVPGRGVLPRQPASNAGVNFLFLIQILIKIM